MKMALHLVLVVVAMGCGDGPAPGALRIDVSGSPTLEHALADLACARMGNTWAVDCAGRDGSFQFSMQLEMDFYESRPAGTVATMRSGAVHIRGWSWNGERGGGEGSDTRDGDLVLTVTGPGALRIDGGFNAVHQTPSARVSFGGIAAHF